MDDRYRLEEKKPSLTGDAVQVLRLVQGDRERLLQNDVLAALQRALPEAGRGLLAAHELADDVDLGGGQHIVRVLREDVGRDVGARFRDALHQRLRHAEIDAVAAQELVVHIVEQVPDAAADVAAAEKTEVHCFCHGGSFLSSRHLPTPAY